MIKRSYAKAFAFCLALGLLQPTALLAQSAPTPELSSAQPGFERFRIGTIDVLALSDGTGRLPLVEGFVRNAGPGELQRLLAEHAQPTAVSGSVNIYLIKLGARVILIDGGAGETFGPTAGKAPLSLAAAGIHASDISDVFVTHMHLDHVVGLLDAGRARYPNATIHVARQELDYWKSPVAQAEAQGYAKTVFAQTASLLDPYGSRVRTFDGPTTFFPGFRAEPAAGHTPGHTIYVLEDGDQSLHFEGDVLNVAIQFDDPALSLIFDGEMAQAQATRRSALDEAVSKNQLVALTHISFPGVGHVRRTQAGYRWIPVDYVNDAPAR